MKKEKKKKKTAKEGRCIVEKKEVRRGSVLLKQAREARGTRSAMVGAVVEVVGIDGE